VCNLNKVIVAVREPGDLVTPVKEAQVSTSPKVNFAKCDGRLPPVETETTNGLADTDCAPSFKPVD
jgi:hypothetical protein